MLAQSGGGAEVRITAQRLEDGRTEFGLQQRVDGDDVAVDSRPSVSEYAFRPEQAPEIFGYRATAGWSVQVPVHILAQLHSSDQVSVTVTGANDESVTATFSTDGIFDAPIQPNIDRCGTYY